MLSLARCEFAVSILPFEQSSKKNIVSFLYYLFQLNKIFM